VHLPLDGRGLPTGERVVARAEHGAISRRTFDDLYALTTRRSFALESESAAVRVVTGDGYGYVQVWVPPARPFAALEPMVVATDALRAGPVPLVEPGDSYRARATLVLQ
jgi:galactose mutarotase-like enzyme